MSDLKVLSDTDWLRSVAVTLGSGPAADKCMEIAAEITRLRAELKKFDDIDVAICEAQHQLGAKEGEILLETAIRVGAELVAANTALSAWHSVFSTSQLSHAQARLEVAEKDAAAAKRNNAKLLRDLAGYSDTEADGIVFCGKCGARIERKESGND